MGSVCEGANNLCTEVKAVFLLKLINNVSKGLVQRILHVTSVNQLRCLIFTDTGMFIIVMLEAVV